MAETVDESTIRKFVHRVFRKSDNIGTLTVKSVREQFLEYLGIEGLDAEQKKLFKNSVHDIYAVYANKQKEQSGDQGSDVEDSQTSTQSDNDTTASSTSTSPKKKKRRIESDIESDQETAHSDSNREEININNNNVCKENQRGKKSKRTKEQALKDEEREIDKAGSEEVKCKQISAAKNRKSPEVESVTGSSDEEQQKEKKILKNKNVEVNGRKRKSVETNSEEEDGEEEEEEKEDKTETSNKQLLQGSEDEKESVDSSSSESIDAEQKQVAARKKLKSKSMKRNLDKDIDGTTKKKLKKKSKTSPGTGAKNKKSSAPTEDSAKLRNLKRYARTCGMHFKYVDIFADCKSMSQKEKKLDRLIRDRTGFEGRITLQMCVKYKKKKEEEDEIAELDCRNIITTDGHRRPTRSTRTGPSNQPPPSTVPFSDDSSVFSRLKGVVDSDESDSENEHTSEKQRLNAFVDNEDSYENRKKRRRLDSSSEDDEN